MHQNWFLIIRGFGFFWGVLKFCHMMILYTVNWNPSLFWAKRLYPSISWESRLRYRPLILLLKSSHWCIGLSTIRRGKTAWTYLLNYQLRLSSSFAQKHIEGDSASHTHNEVKGILRILMQSQYVSSKTYKFGLSIRMFRAGVLIQYPLFVILVLSHTDIM